MSNESEASTDSCADVPPLVRYSSSRMSYSSPDSDYQTKFDGNDPNSNEECVFSSSNSEDNYLYDDAGYESEDSCVDMPDLTSQNQHATNTMKKLDTSSNPVTQSIVESQESVRLVANENTEGSNTNTIDTEESIITDVSNYLVDVA